MANEKKEKVSKARLTLVGNVDVNEVVNLVSSKFPNVQLKVWNKRGKAQKKVSPDSETTQG